MLLPTRNPMNNRLRYWLNTLGSTYSTWLLAMMRTERARVMGSVREAVRSNRCWNPVRRDCTLNLIEHGTF